MSDFRKMLLAFAVFTLLVVIASAQNASQIDCASDPGFCQTTEPLAAFVQENNSGYLLLAVQTVEKRCVLTINVRQENSIEVAQADLSATDCALVKQAIKAAQGRQKAPVQLLKGEGNVRLPQDAR